MEIFKLLHMFFIIFKNNVTVKVQLAQNEPALFWPCSDCSFESGPFLCGVIPSVCGTIPSVCGTNSALYAVLANRPSTACRYHLQDRPLALAGIASKAPNHSSSIVCLGCFLKSPQTRRRRVVLWPRISRLWANLIACCQKQSDTYFQKTNHSKKRAQIRIRWPKTERQLATLSWPQ